MQTQQVFARARARARAHTTIKEQGDESHHKELKHQNPLYTMKSFAQRRNLCDDDGFRKGIIHWTFALALNDTTTEDEKRKAPILRTVNFQRVSSNGVDFIMKNRGHDLLFVKDHQYVSFLYTEGKYLPGQTVQQWRAQGVCHPIRLEEVLQCAPASTICEMVASVRASKEGDAREDIDTSHILDLVQEARNELEEGDISKLELDEAIRAWRFVPHRVERMVGGPASPMWHRTEWLREEAEGSEWMEPKRLMPF